MPDLPGYDKDLQQWREPTIWHFDRLQFQRWLAEHGRYDAPELEIYRPMGPSSGDLALPALTEASVAHAAER